MTTRERLGKKRSPKIRCKDCVNLARARNPTPALRCPECGSKRFYRDGLRYLKDGSTVQRWLCRDCGYRFSEPKVKVNVSRKTSKLFNPSSNLAEKAVCDRNLPIQKSMYNLSFLNGEDVGSRSVHLNVTNIGKDINTNRSHNRKHQVGAALTRGAKNLTEVESRIEKRVAGATEKPDLATVKGKVIEFAWWMQKQGYAESTYQNRPYLIERLVKLGANLYDPESVKEVLARQKWGNGYKANFVDAYSSFLQMEGLTWGRDGAPRYKRPETLAFIPTEAELNQLIAAASKLTGAFLQGLKDTGADPGELGAITWMDINKEGRTVTINHPVKGHNSRILEISEDFINRLSVLPKKGERIFNYPSIKRNFYSQRKRIAHRLGNPRLRKISFITFRHWKGTVEYHRTKDILYVQKILGHKSLQSTLVYIDYEKAVFGSPNQQEFTVRVATNVEETCELVKAGFDYVTGEYTDGGKIFRKRK